ncbi:MAG: efflux RND transporter periplasmic adaptor subunit [Planctomycetota bacterium]|nr:MAG: efflux RND transporter periplasmic adaptor subunit [Planctomycetota bacterium]
MKVRQNLFNLANMEHNLRLIPKRRKEAQILAAIRKIQWELAKRSFHLSQVRAPFPGWITARHVEVGQRSDPGQFFFEIQGRVLEAQVDLPSYYLPKLQLHLPVEITAAAFPGKWKGEILRIHPSLEERTKTVRVYIGLKEKSPFFKAGLFVQAIIYLKSHSQAIVIPRLALKKDQKVMVLEKGVVQAKKVEIGAMMDDRVMVTKGLQPGDLVILDPIDLTYVGKQAEGTLVSMEKILKSHSKVN